MGAFGLDCTPPLVKDRADKIRPMVDRQNYHVLGGFEFLVGLGDADGGGAGGGGAQVVDNSDYRACPMCAEDIKRAAIKCKHCGADVVSLNTDVNLENSEPVVLPVAEAAVENKTRVWLACGTLYILFFGLVTALIIGRNG